CEIRLESRTEQRYPVKGWKYIMSAGHQGGLAGLWAVGGQQVSVGNDQDRRGYYQYFRWSRLFRQQNGIN
ncbi:MAG: hypothetical protein ACNA8H_16775, partial [Anaerolineales bacterium]